MAEPAAPEALEEVAIGGTPAGRAANAALRCFSKAARAFTLYDPQNEAVRRFLAEYRDALKDFLGKYGALDLEVRQFELARSGEVVHAEKDREKSLAYRLYRDGIRRLVIKPEATWDEELKLLEVLSVRFIGVRQQEEDVVTLLTRAAFRHIEFGAASGLVAEKDEEAAPRRKAARTYPPDFDGPAPPLLPPRQFGHFAIPPLALAEFEAEESAATLPGNAVRMVRELLDDANEEELKTLVPAVEEVRDFLLAELDLKQLRNLARVLTGQFGNTAKVLGPALKPLAAPYTLTKLLATVPKGAEPPDDLVDLLDLLARYGADLFDPLVERMAAAGSDKTLETLARRAAHGKRDRVLARLESAEPALAQVLLSFLEPADKAEAAKKLAASDQEGAQLAAVRLADAPEALLPLLSSFHPAVRTAAAESLAKLKAKKAFEPLSAIDPADEREAEAVGAALGAVAPAEALALFESWVHPPKEGGLLSRLKAKKPKRLQLWEAASGLVQVPGEKTLALLREISGGAQDDELLKKHALKCIHLWRKAHG